MVPRQTPMIIDTPPTPIEAQGIPPVATKQLRRRSRSLQWLNTFFHEHQSRSSSASSRHSRSPDSVKDVIANLGLAAGTVGAEQIKPERSRDEDVSEGIKVFLSGFQNIVRRAGTGLDKTVETIEVGDDAQSVHSFHPITEAERNPFCSTTDAGPATPTEPVQEHKEQEDARLRKDKEILESPKSSISREGSFGDFVMDISMYEKDSGQKLFCRARLDTGMTGNAVSHSQAIMLGYPIVKYTGDPCIVADGSLYHPLGQVTLPFYFVNFRTAKTWHVEFIVFPDHSPFDLCLGRRFISLADLLKRNPEALPLEFQKLKPSEEMTKKHKTHQANQDSGYTRDRQDKGYDERRTTTKPKEKEPRKWRS